MSIRDTNRELAKQEDFKRQIDSEMVPGKFRSRYPKYCSLDCTCESDPLGRCVVHKPLEEKPIADL